MRKAAFRGLLLFFAAQGFNLVSSNQVHGLHLLLAMSANQLRIGENQNSHRNNSKSIKFEVRFLKFYIKWGDLEAFSRFTQIVNSYLPESYPSRQNNNNWKIKYFLTPQTDSISKENQCLSPTDSTVLKYPQHYIVVDALIPLVNVFSDFLFLCASVMARLFLVDITPRPRSFVFFWQDSTWTN